MQLPGRPVPRKHGGGAGAVLQRLLLQEHHLLRRGAEHAAGVGGALREPARGAQELPVQDGGVPQGGLRAHHVVQRGQPQPGEAGEAQVPQQENCGPEAEKEDQPQILARLHHHLVQHRRGRQESPEKERQREEGPQDLQVQL